MKKASRNLCASALLLAVAFATSCDLSAKLPIRLLIEDIATTDPEWEPVDAAGLTAGATGAVDAQFGYAVDISDNYAIVGAPFQPEGGSDRGAAYILAKAADGSWQIQQKINSETQVDSEYFGGAVAITEDYAVVASQGINLMEIFARSGSTWSKVDERSITSGSLVTSVDISGDYILAADYTTGRAGVYHRGTGWPLEDTLDGNGAYQYGFSVSLDGDYAVIGADTYNVSESNGGAVYVFQRSGTVWNPIGSVLEPQIPSANAYFGASVAVRDNHVVIGATGTATAAVFEIVGSTCSFVSEHTVPGVLIGDNFGSAVAVAGQSFVVGAYSTDSTQGKGSAHTFWYKDGAWHYKNTLSYLSGNAGDSFGFALAACGHSLIIGAPSDDNANGSNAGSVFLYRH
jgi:hypothetical protein